MTLEDTIFATLKPVKDAVHRDVAPPTLTKEQREAGYITFQQVGGASINYLEGGAVGLRTPRVQISVWGKGRDAVNGLALQAEAALRAAAALQTDVLGEFVAIIDETTGLCGTQQDFRLSFTA